MGEEQITVVILSYMLMQGLVRSEYTVNVASQSTWVNPGDMYVGYCNIPGVKAIDMINNLEVEWFHNSQQLTNFCQFLSSELAQKYSCSVLGPQINNISFQLTVTNVQKKDEGNLTCGVYEQFRENETEVRGDLVAMKSVPIQVREPMNRTWYNASVEPIKSMRFKFDPSIELSLTEENTEALHPMQVSPGRYAPTCQVMGSNPTPNIRIMMGSDLMNGTLLDMEDMGTQFVAEDTDFRSNSKVNVMCSAEVDGLPNSKMQRTYQIFVRKGDLKFKCTNSSAIVNNKRHKITCEVYNVEGIFCNKINWKKGDTGEDYRPGGYNNINVSCREITNSKIETTLEILQVTAEYLKTSFSVIYNDPLFQTKEYQLSIPEEYSNSVVALQSSLVLLCSIVFVFIP